MTKRHYAFGVITDEIDSDFARACHIAHELSMVYVELHELWGKAIHELSDTELAQAKAIVDEYGLHTHLASFFLCGLFFRPFSLGDEQYVTERRRLT